MRYSDTDAYAMIQSIGDEASVGAETVYVVELTPYDVDYSGGEFGVTVMMVTLVEQEITRLGLTEGDDGSVITVSGQPYRVLSLVPDGDGFATARLGVV